MSARSLDTESSPLLHNYSSSALSNVSTVIREDEDAITIRRPIQYSINAERQPIDHERTAVTVNRYRYYNRLAPYRESTLVMPNHVVPPEYFLVIPFKTESGNQSSIITIFSIWNTMVGTSILSMPWALEKAGFGCGIILMLAMAAITTYTAYLVVKSPQKAGYDSGVNSTIEFSDICKHYLGRWGEYISIIFSLITLMGASVVYWVLMTNFLYNSVTFIYNEVTHEFNSSYPLSNITSIDDSIICPNSYTKNASHSWSDDINYHDNLLDQSNGSLFTTIWKQRLTVPFFLVLVILPIVNLKSPTFFTKFNALGTLSILYILILVSVKAGQWGVNMQFDSSNMFYLPEFQWTFPILSGILSLAMFIHNCIISIMRNQKNPENNGRDLTIAYGLVAGTYIIVGVLFCMCFPLPKTCIEDNLLNNFMSSDVLAFTARIFLFFQMVTVFPLLLYIFRIQVFTTLYNTQYPGLFRVVLLNLGIISLGILFAIFLPNIGTIIRFSGAFCGFVYIFTLPCLVYLLSLPTESRSWKMIILHGIIIVLGGLNFIAQIVLTVVPTSKT